MMWYDYVRLPRSASRDYNNGFSVSLPSALDAGDIDDILRQLLERHEGLRSTYPFDIDRGPMQVVWEAAPVSAEISPNLIAVEDLPAALEDLRAPGFRLASDWPIRAAVLRSPGGIRTLACVVHHITADEAAVHLLAGELRELAASKAEGREPRLGAVPQQPLDLAEADLGESGAKRNEAALAFWRTRLAVAPGHVFVRPHTPDADRELLVACLRSAAAAEAVAALSKRHGTSPATLLLTAFTSLVGAVSGVRRCPITVQTSNRRRSGLDGMITNLFQSIDPCFDLNGDPRFSELVRRVAREYLKSLRHGRYSFDDAAEQRSLVALERGIEFRHATSFSYSERSHSYLGLPTRRVENIPALREGSEFYWEPSDPDPDIDTFLTIYASPGDITIALAADNSILDADALRNAVLAMEGLLVDCARGDDPRLSETTRRLDVSPAPERGDLREVDGCLISIDEVQEVITRHPGAGRALVTISASESRTRLKAFIEARSPTLTTASVRSHLQGELHRHPHLMIPDWFVVCRQAPIRATDPGAWRLQPVAEEGTGRTPAASASDPLDPRTAALVSAVCRSNGLTEASRYDTYVSCGGRAARVAGVRTELRRLGYNAPHPEALLSTRPLWSVASELLSLPPQG